MSDQRRKRIRRQIRRASTWHSQQAPPKKKNEQAHILAGLNVLAVLAETAPDYLPAHTHYGPAAFSGAGWANAVVWYHEAGYEAYRTLTLFGVWVIAQDADHQVIVGAKSLAYSAPIYNAESFHTLIRQGYRTYYADDGTPPAPDHSAYRAPYDITRRLALRRELADVIRVWLRTHDFDAS